MNKEHESLVKAAAANIVDCGAAVLGCADADLPRAIEALRASMRDADALVQRVYREAGKIDGRAALPVVMTADGPMALSVGASRRRYLLDPAGEDRRQRARTIELARAQASDPDPVTREGARETLALYRA